MNTLMSKLLKRYTPEQIRAMVMRSVRTSCGVEGIVLKPYYCHLCGYDIVDGEPKHIYKPTDESRGFHYICDKCYIEIVEEQ